MAKSVDSQMGGFKQLAAQLKEAGMRDGGKYLRSSVGLAMTPTLKEARNSAPVGSVAHRTYKGRLVAPGFASRNVKKKTTKSKDGTFASAKVGVLSEAFYAVHFSELGTDITRHQTAKPWLEPAFARTRHKAQAALGKQLRKKLDRARRIKGK